MKYVNNNIQILDKADVIVIGGGVAGSVAAISALNEGKSVIIIEKTNYLGGSATNSLVIPFMRSKVANPNGLNVDLNKQYLEFDKNAKTNGSIEAISANPITYAMFYDKYIRKLGGIIYYDATFIDTVKEDNKIKYVLAYVHNELFAFEGKCFVDTSAEGLVAKSVGCKLMHGNENNNNIHQCLSLRFEMGGVDKVRLCEWLKNIKYVGFGIPNDPNELEFVLDDSYKDIIDAAIKNGEVTVQDMKYIQAFRVNGKMNTFAFNAPQISETYNPDDSKEYSRCVEECLLSLSRYSAFFINHIPGFEKAYIANVASQLGIRESVRVKTKYVLQNEDYINRATFEDGIAKSDWYVDVHTDNLENHNFEMYKPGEYYEVPYRSLIVDECDNLIIGGRIIGASFRVEASIRIQVTLRDISEVIGKACAYSINKNIDLNKIDGKVFKVNY